MDQFLELSRTDQLEALATASSASGRPAHLLEKDVWVVWSLNQLFTGPHAPHLVFKGGTSLSKAYQIIRRFSEDVDITYDIRQIVPELVGDKNPPLPKSRSQEKKWTDEIRHKLPDVLRREILPPLAEAARKVNAEAKADGDKIYVEYGALATGTGYVKPMITLEFGARSTGEPSEQRSVTCEASKYLSEIEFPSATPTVMRPERTFWEKATAIHVFCIQGEFRGGERFSRHWHDVTRLDETGFAERAMADAELAKSVADHKSRFFAEKDAEGKPIDYYDAVGGKLRLVPTGKARATLEEDYGHMVDDGLLLDDAETFESLLDKCRVIEGNANGDRTVPPS